MHGGACTAGREAGKHSLAPVRNSACGLDLDLPKFTGAGKADHSRHLKVMFLSVALQVLRGKVPVAETLLQEVLE